MQAVINNSNIGVLSNLKYSVTLVWVDWVQE